MHTVVHRPARRPEPLLWSNIVARSAAGSALLAATDMYHPVFGEKCLPAPQEITPDDPCHKAFHLAFGTFDCATALPAKPYDPRHLQRQVGCSNCR